MSESTDRVVLEESWKRLLLDEFDKPYMRTLREFLVKEKKARKRIYPKGSEIFAALDATPFEQVRVVVIGQDPYHGPNQAHGLCFSVLPGVAQPPSLVNIFQEINDDMTDPSVPGVNIDPSVPDPSVPGVNIRPRLQPGAGCLRGWAAQGVLLLNSVLTVERGRAGSHQDKGWEVFTDRIVALLNGQRDGLVFLLWGGYAQKKGAIVDGDRHRVLKAAHPSPLSAHRGFFGCRHFSAANRYLGENGSEPIDWFAVE